MQLNLPDVDGAVEGTPSPEVPEPLPEPDEAEEGVPAVAAESAEEGSDDVPVLVPDSEEADDVDSFADTHVPLVVPDAETSEDPVAESPAAKADTEDADDIDLPELDSDDTFKDELVVSEWPDPAESGG